MELNQNLYPPDGYVFRERDGFLIRGDSWRNLAVQVDQYRSNRGLSTATTWDEIVEQTCRRAPSQCRGGPPPGLGDAPPYSVKDRLMDWLLETARAVKEKTVKHVTSTEMQTRASLCSQCELRKTYSNGCSQCESTMESHRRIILQQRDRGISSDLPCHGLIEDVSVSTWLDLPRVNEPRLPGHCWRKAK